MFETLWLSPYDRRRRNTVYAEYEMYVRHAARVLTGIDLAAANEEQLQLILQAVHTLADSIRQLSGEGIFPPARCRAATEAVERIRQAADEKIAVR